jgi:hypothetical protein
MNLKLLPILFGALLSCSSLISAQNNLTISYNGFTTFCGGELSEPQCTGSVNITPVSSGGCSDAIFFWKIDLDAQTFQDSDLAGGGPIDQRLPLGNHIVRFSGRDFCGNQAELDIKIEVVDCTPPVPVCYNGLVVDLLPYDGMEIYASDFDAASFDNCYGYETRINLVTDKNNDGIINSDDFLAIPPNSHYVDFRCQDLGPPHLVQLWVKELSNDRFNNWSYCVSEVKVQDGGYYCGDRPHIQGTVSNLMDTPLKEVEMISGWGTRLTDDNGYYHIFLGLFFDPTEIKANKEGAVKSGISIEDLHLISQHILGKKELETPFHLIAADVNQSISITTLDLIYLKNILFGRETQFPNNKNWIFIPKNFNFSNPKAPWNIPSSVKITTMGTSGAQIDFKGIKLGDVTGDANFKQPDKSLEPRSAFQYALPEMDLEKDMEYSIPVKSLNKVEAVQAALQLSPDLELISIENGAIDLETSMAFDEASNTLKFIGVGESIEEGEILFTLHLKTRQSGNTNDLIRLSQEELESKVLLAGGETINGELYFQKDSNSGIKTTASPNPFSDQINIRFEIENSSSLDFRITDIQGKEIYASYASYESGLHEIVVPGSLFPRAGIYYYQFKSEDVFQVGKIIHLK